MNASEAREIVSREEARTDIRYGEPYEVTRAQEYLRAHKEGYLAALAGPEATALVDGIKFSLTKGTSADAEKALREFEKAAKP